MEGSLGADLSAVRIHTGPDAARSAGALGAAAYTSGRHVVFADGAFAPQTAGGQRTLTHELVHVVQQARGPVAGRPTPDGRLSISDPSDSFEREAEREADRAAGQVTSEAAASPAGDPVAGAGAGAGPRDSR